MSPEGPGGGALGVATGATPGSDAPRLSVWDLSTQGAGLTALPSSECTQDALDASAFITVRHSINCAGVHCQCRCCGLHRKGSVHALGAKFVHQTLWRLLFLS